MTDATSGPAVQPAVDPAVDPANEEQPAAAGRSASALFAALLLVVLTGLAIALGVTRHSGGTVTALAGPAGGTASQQAILAAARAEGVAVTTLSWRTANNDLDRILAGAQPGSSLYDQFAKRRPDLKTLLARNHSVSQGTALSSALSSLTGGTATALVAVDANISGSNGSPTVKHYRMVFGMRHVGTHWLATSVSFQGPPQ